MQIKQQWLVPAAALAIVFVIGVGLLMMKKGPGQKGPTTTDVLPTQVQLPPVEDSVSATVTADKRKEYVTVAVTGVPSDVTDIEVELAYTDKQGNTDAAIDVITIEAGKKVEKKLALGTCSATCTFDFGGGAVNLRLKFNGTKGSRLFEKEYTL